MEKNEILKIYGTDYREMTFELLKRAELADLLPEKKDCRIGIKPNLVNNTPPSYGATTHPEVVAGIIEYLQQHGYRNILVLEGSWAGARTADAVKVCGYDTLCQKYGVDFCDTQKEHSFEKNCAGMNLHLCSCVKEIDFLINVPVLKGHCQTRITCALKNMKGLLPNREKRRFHTLGLHDPIAHLNAGVRQDFIVTDHICGDLDFEEGGNPVVCNCVMAARDPVLMDACVCEELHYSVDEVPYVRKAEQLGVGSADISRAKITECSPALKGTDQIPEVHKVLEVQDAVQEVESCSACYAYLMPALVKLREEGLLQKLDEKICIGQGFRGKSGSLGIGRCTDKFLCHLDGCPPLENDIYDFLRSYILQEI